MIGSRKLWIKLGANLSKGLRTLLLLLLAAYRTIGTTHLGGSCRFEPSCSEFAVLAVRTHSPLKALLLIFGRILKCRPGGPMGLDPVPPATQKRMT